jgi:signal transduction histidine kinase/CheY-like chemotaxis protein
VGNVIVDEALPALGASVGLVAVLTEDGRSLRNICFRGAAPAAQANAAEYPLTAPLPAAEAVAKGRPIMTSTREERDARFPALAELLSDGARAGGGTAAFPLVLDQKSLGALMLGFNGPCAFDAEEISFLCSLADQCALAVDRASLHETAQREISDRKDAEAALREANRRKDEFLAMLAHELRNPLAPIRTATQILQRLEPGDARAVKMHDVIERQSAHLARIVDDLLDVSRVTQGRMVLSRARMDLVDWVQQTVGDHRAVIESAGLTLEKALPETPIWVFGDGMRIAQLVASLLDNAEKFTRAGGTIRVALEVEGDQVHLTVADTGLGMEDDVLSHLFEPFAQADRSLARSGGGLGLGLALVKGIAELHGGTVSAQSAGLGRGSTFNVTFQRSDAGLPSAPPSPRVPTVPRRVLVIEDNVDAAETLRDLLALQGHEVRVAYEGNEGIAIANLWSPEVVLSDIGLPGDADGYDVARALSRGNKGKRAYLVALSGYGSDADRAQGTEAGFDVYLTKPVSASVLMQTIAEAPSDSK